MINNNGFTFFFGDRLPKPTEDRCQPISELEDLVKYLEVHAGRVSHPNKLFAKGKRKMAKLKEKYFTRKVVGDWKKQFMQGLKDISSNYKFSLPTLYKTTAVIQEFMKENNATNSHEVILATLESICLKPEERCFVDRAKILYGCEKKSFGEAQDVLKTYLNTTSIRVLEKIIWIAWRLNDDHKYCKSFFKKLLAAVWAMDPFMDIDPIALCIEALNATLKYWRIRDEATYARLLHMFSVGPKETAKAKDLIESVIKKYGRLSKIFGLED